MKLIFYPNNCYVCKTTTSLKRCSRCQLISYCGEKHQIQNWNRHKEFCGIISKIMKVNNLTHIYEHLRGCTLEMWTNARKGMIDKVKCLLDRKLEGCETEMLLFPRSCYVCYDTKHSNLKSCPNCPLVSFCKEHPNSSLHDKECSKTNATYIFEIEYDDHEKQTMNALEEILHCPMESSKVPNSLNDYLDQTLGPVNILNEKIRKYVSLFITSPLTIFNSLQKLNFPPSSEIVIDTQKQSSVFGYPQYWEILLHLLPNLNLLKLIINKENVLLTEEKNLPLCENCRLKRKQLIVKTIGSFCLAGVDYEKPDLIVFTGFNSTDVEDISLSSVTDFYASLNDCSLIFSTSTETQATHLIKRFNSPKWKSLICFNGKNNFSSTCSFRTVENWTMGEYNKFLLVIKAPSLRAKENVENTKKVSQKVLKNDDQNNSSEKIVKEIKEIQLISENSNLSRDDNQNENLTIEMNDEKEVRIENFNQDINVESLLKNNVLVFVQEEINKLHKENLYLKEENERLRNEALKRKN